MKKRKENMQRPITKDELLFQSEEAFINLLDLIKSFPDEYQSKTYTNNELNDRDKTFADILMHLHEWHLMRKNWYDEGMAGKKPSLSYSLQQLAIINKSIWEKHQGTELKKAIELFKESHKEIIALINHHTDEELFTKKKYFFTGSTTLGAYLFYNTADHYQWAFKTIQKIRGNR
jgi:hypothetical protein